MRSGTAALMVAIASVACAAGESTESGAAPTAGVISVGGDTGSSFVDPSISSTNGGSDHGPPPDTTETGDTCPVGAEGCDCTPGGACDEPLACLAGTCTTVPAECGNAQVETGEACDDGPANADDAACTSSCTAAYCGDGLVLAGGELCDDGTNDGSYGGCLADCSDRGPHCGDGVLDPEEACDAADASCIGCTVATSCLKIHEADPALQSGPRTIFPIGPDNPLSVYCDMTSDGGGYTFLKVDIDSELNDLPYPAKKAETTCAMFGMKLLVPRSPAHLAVAHSVAMGADILPVGGGQKPSGADYLQILGIYPKQSSKSCLGNVLSALTCPQWAPSDGGTWYIADTVKNAAEPDPDGACLGCSMLYTWNPDATVKNYKTLPNPGGSSLRFMCDVGDKVP